MPEALEVTICVRQPRRGTKRPAVEATSDLPRVPRVARLMALAIKFEDMVARGEVRDYADLARLGLVSRARMSQLMNLLLLAPDLQEKLLFGEWVVPEREIRGVVSKPEWHSQRSLV